MALRESIKQGETVIAEVGISKRAILVEWLALPTVFLVFFLTVCLPVILRTLAVDAAKAAFEAAVGIEDAGAGDVLAHVWQAIMPNVPHWVTILIQVPVWIAVFVWFVLCSVNTVRHFGYEVILTDKRVLARARNEVFECGWAEMKNVFIEQSLWGRWLHYGSITFQGPRGSLTVRHVTDPDTIKDRFKAYTDTF